MTPFPCTRCGLCCRNLKGNEVYRSLDRGDGICRHLDEATNLCTIYEQRPLLCRVDQAWEACFQNQLSREEYHAINLAACRHLQVQAGIISEE